MTKFTSEKMNAVINLLGVSECIQHIMNPLGVTKEVVLII